MARAKKVPCEGGGKIAFRAGPRTTTVNAMNVVTSKK
jgi:hypothetical protein